jgi:hypothetical protein
LVAGEPVYLIEFTGVWVLEGSRWALLNAYATFKARVTHVCFIGFNLGVGYDPREAYPRPILRCDQ